MKKIPAEKKSPFAPAIAQGEKRRLAPGVKDIQTEEKMVAAASSLTSS